MPWPYLLFNGMRKIDYAEPPRYTPRDVDALTDQAYAAGYLAGWRAGRDRAATHVRSQVGTGSWIADEIDALSSPPHVPAPDGSGWIRPAMPAAWYAGPPRTAFRCSGCGAVRGVASLAACPYPARGRGPLHRWHPVPA